MFCALVLTVSMLAVPASAASHRENLKAYIYGGAVVSSVSAKKERSGNYNYSASPYTSDGWSARGDEWVYIRGRHQNYAQATNFARINYTGRQKDGSLTYLSGYGKMNDYYRVAIEYDNNNPYQYVYLAVSWNP